MRLLIRFPFLILLLPFDLGAQPDCLSNQTALAHVSRCRKADFDFRKVNLSLRDQVEVIRENV